MVCDTRDDAQALWDEVGTVLTPIGLRLVGALRVWLNR